MAWAYTFYPKNSRNIFVMVFPTIFVDSFFSVLKSTLFFAEKTLIG